MNTSTQLDDLIEQFFPYRYPNYNLGLLPDEDGYDEVQERDHYLITEARQEAKRVVTAWADTLAKEVINSGIFIDPSITQSELVLSLREAQLKRLSQLLNRGGDE